MKRALTLILVLAAALPLAASASACGDAPNAVNLVLTRDVRGALRHAFTAARPGIRAELVRGRTYYGYHVGIQYAVATFSIAGRTTYPAIFSDGGNGRWRLLRITHGGICSGVVPVDLIQAWSLVHWQGGCYVEPRV
jgi:hypothetical protein